MSMLPEGEIRARILKAGYRGLCSTPPHENSAASYLFSAREALTAMKELIQEPIAKTRELAAQAYRRGETEAHAGMNAVADERESIVAEIAELLTVLGAGEIDHGQDSPAMAGRLADRVGAGRDRRTYGEIIGAVGAGTVQPEQETGAPSVKEPKK